jgi:hypothetical protein
LNRGRIIEVAPDWGSLLKQKFSEYETGDWYMPGVGDIVWFVPNETFALDPEKKYHLINDTDIVAYERGNE